MGASSKTGANDESNNPVVFNATVENVDGLPLFSKTAAIAKARSSQSVASDEYYMTLEAKVKIDRFPWLESVKNEEVEFILALDKSGSMSGRPWKQVQEALVHMIELTSANPKISMKIMTYCSNSQWEEVSAVPEQAAFQIRKIRSGGSTNFVSVFDKISSYLESGQTVAVGSFMKKAMASIVKPEKPKNKKFIFFMTDGCDTVSGEHEIMASKERLQDKIAAYGEEVVVNVLGFSRNHNDAFLESLTLIGTSDGSYNFIPEDQGDSALEKKLTELLEETSGLVGKSVFLELKMENEAQFLGDWFGEGDKEVVLQAFMHVEDGLARIKTAKFVTIPKDGLKMKISMMRDLREDDTQIIPCTLAADTIDAKVAFNDKMRMLKLRTSLNLLTAKLGNAVTDGDVEKTTKLVQEWFQVVKVYAGKIDLASASQSSDADVKKLADAVQNGIALLERTLTQRPGQDHNSYMKGMRGAHADLMWSTNQAQNFMQVKSKSSGGPAPAHRARPKQMMQRFNDIM